MKPIVVSVHVLEPREQVFASLDVLANHERFTDHMLVDWSYSGAASEAPAPTVSSTVGAGGRRRTRGTYTLREAAGGGTDVEFRLEYLAIPASERLAAPLTRVWLRRANARAMQRLAGTLSSSQPLRSGA